VRSANHDLFSGEKAQFVCLRDCSLEGSLHVREVMEIATSEDEAEEEEDSTA